MKNKMIEFLLNNANPSIKRRIKSEILHSLTLDEAALYQEQIMKETNIQQIIACQKENGWLRDTFHGGRGTQEDGTKYLAEGSRFKDAVLKNIIDHLISEKNNCKIKFLNTFLTN